MKRKQPKNCVWDFGFREEGFFAKVSSGEKNGDIGHENSRKPVCGFRLLGEKRKRGILQRSPPVRSFFKVSKEKTTFADFTHSIAIAGEHSLKAEKYTKIILK